jgi:AcrR family transcriptional regulator
MATMPAPTVLELLWGSQDQPRRGPKPSLTLGRIITEAIALADAEGLANLSMQRLAERLGCAKMALYRYVPGKGELTALMLDTALGGPPEPVAHQSDSSEAWRDYLRVWSDTIHHRFRSHPWAMELANGVRPMGPNELAWLEAALVTLADTPLTGTERLDTVVLLLSHARSLVLHVGGAQDETDLEGGLVQQMGAVLMAHADIYPHAVAAFADQPGRNDALNFGIDRILDGLGALMAARGNRDGV